MCSGGKQRRSRVNQEEGNHRRGNGRDKKGHAERCKAMDNLSAEARKKLKTQEDKGDEHS